MNYNPTAQSNSQLTAEATKTAAVVEEQKEAKAPVVHVEDEPVSEVDTKLAQRKVWLLKIPQVLMECWEDSREGGNGKDRQEIGLIKIFYDAKTKDTKFIKLYVHPAVHEIAKKKGVVLSKTYQLSVHKKESTSQNYIFSEEAAEDVATKAKDSDLDDTSRKRKGQTDSLAGGSKKMKKDRGVTTSSASKNVDEKEDIRPPVIKIEGAVDTRADLHLPIDQNFDSILTSRYNESNYENNIKLMTLEDLDKNFNKTIKQRNDSFQVTAKTAEDFMAHAPSGDKYVRMDKQDLMKKLFGLFKQHQYYYTKDLRELTEQPESWLREVLQTICIQHSRGPYMNKWELKPEYSMY